MNRTDFIRGFITVLLNALLDLVPVTGRNNTLRDGKFPTYGPILPWGRPAAVDVLVVSVGFADTQDSLAFPSPQLTSYG
ncbi:hypothetical protein BDY19DRAFT_380485 [Irpex rosettiformis]|uniref:Uncharacterized protein n=1 Tax=Irpex rosettiformis TaxID=378272 RepID=A0ACB8TVQ2_9APHY|nr:hypothetical protein BDY19DRAFT_380485 [Irpex rosettiformis]